MVVNKQKAQFPSRTGSDNGLNNGLKSQFQTGTKSDFQPRDQFRDPNGHVVDFNEIVNKAKRNPQPISREAHEHNLRQEQAKVNIVRARQEAQRVLACKREAITNILVTSSFSIMAAIALANFLPQFARQKQNLVQMSTEFNKIEKKVEDLREQFPSSFDAGRSAESNLRRNGWFKPSQVPIKSQTNPSDLSK
jgi:hypothetical protein